MNSTWLELETGKPEEMKQKILKAGGKKIELGLDQEHLYFQAPGGQVFRLVGTDEDLALYEGKY